MIELKNLSTLINNIMALNDLITREDPYHIHKSLGAYVLLHFMYQYYCYFAYGKMFLNVWNLIPHFALHISSFIFHVLETRIVSQNVTSMFIYEELRLHSMIFAFRGLFCILMQPLSPMFIFISMLCGDGATYIFGNGKSRVSKKWYKNAAAAFFSLNQIGATFICGGFFQYKYSMVLAFSTLLPIQTHAFGMTLIRKNIINKQIWQIIYTIELLFTHYFWYYETGNNMILPMSLFLYILTRFGMSKYTIFLSVFLGDIINKVIHYKGQHIVAKLI